MKEIFYGSPNVTRTSLCSFPKHDKVWKQKLKITQGHYMELIV